MKYLSGLLLLSVILIFFYLTPVMAQPVGIYCFSAQVGGCTTTKILNDVNVVGIFRPVKWSDVETSPGVYDYSSLLNDWNLAEAAGKRVEFGLAAGIHTPLWDFSSGLTLPSGTVPLPWDSTYQMAFYNLMSHLPPTIYDDASVDAVYITGLNYRTGEEHILRAGCIENGTDDCTLWLNSGYTPTLLEDSFSTFFSNITTNFLHAPNFVMAIENGGYPLTDTKMDLSMNNKLFGIALNMGHNVWSQNDGWNTNPNSILPNQTIYQEGLPLGTGLCGALNLVLAQSTTRALQIYPSDFTSANASCIHSAAVNLSNR